MTSSSHNLSPREKFIISLCNKKINATKDFLVQQRIFSRDNKLPFFPKDKLIQSYHKLRNLEIINEDKAIERLIRLKETRSMSGIVVVSVLTKPYDCPGECIYCPKQENVPKSYLSDEPAVMRAITCGYNPYKQVTSRLAALKNTGHPIDKISIRIIGGTWSYYKKNYQTWFVKNLFKACNDFADEAHEIRHTLYDEQIFNETASQRIIELSIETRQDYINNLELKRLRKLGITKVELGVQSIYEEVLKINKRGNKNQETVDATKALKDAGFKISYQVMPNLPGSNEEMDNKMFKELFRNSDYKPDHLKIYPLALVKSAPIFKLYQEGRYKPYNKEELVNLLYDIKISLPYFVRVERIIRDIPTEHIIEGGSKVSNMRQEVEKKLIQSMKTCKCIRCREVRDRFDPDEKTILFREDYEASDGKEIFLTIENKNRDKLLSLIRLRVPSTLLSNQKPLFKSLENAAIVREIHTYGMQLPISQNKSGSCQHKGLGKKLLAEAEKIAREEFNAEKIAVIAGVGVREYFRKNGYHLEDTYMLKELR